MRDEEFCPKCNAILNDQKGYESRLNAWIYKDISEDDIELDCEEYAIELKIIKYLECKYMTLF